jgi:hypothetical protein
MDICKSTKYNTEDLKNIKIKGKPLYCYTSGITSHVLTLHEHMGHLIQPKQCVLHLIKKHGSTPN